MLFKQIACRGVFENNRDPHLIRARLQLKFMQMCPPQQDMLLKTGTIKSTRPLADVQIITDLGKGGTRDPINCEET